MIVQNVNSNGKSVVMGNTYYAKVDRSGAFRVKDGSGRWSKYSARNFKILEDTDNQMACIGKPAIEYAVEKSKHVVWKLGSEKEDKPTTFETETIDEGLSTLDEVLKDLEDKGIETKIVEKVEVKKVEKTRYTLRELLVKQGVPDSLITEMNKFRNNYSNAVLPDNIKSRIPKNVELYEGGSLWIQCITAILAGKHILLSGGKATGKNTLANSLAFAFQRPIWDTSFHKSIGKDEIIGSETFRDGNVVFNPGMAYMCAVHGGFGVLDEINMANEGAIAVLNSILDNRRVIDVPGYDRINLHDATTFIGTMNYGYAGTRPLNEALASRFVVPTVKELDLEAVIKLLAKKFKTANIDILKYFAGVFQDLQQKAHNAEISTASVDLRGIISALAMIEYGIAPSDAMESNVVNKSFEEFERKIVQDVVKTRIPNTWTSEDVFGETKTIVVDMSEA